MLHYVSSSFVVVFQHARHAEGVTVFAHESGCDATCQWSTPPEIVPDKCTRLRETPLGHAITACFIRSTGYAYDRLWIINRLKDNQADAVVLSSVSKKCS